MKIDKTKHKELMLKILADIADEPVLAMNLGFKGGTACYFLYGLDRFSVDLDFDLLDVSKRDEVLGKIDSILKKYGIVKMGGNVFSRKLKYSEDASSLKIDVSDRSENITISTYAVIDIVSGVPLKVMSKADMFAHKLVALKERYDDKSKYKQIANRDLFDIDFFFQNNWEYNPDVIHARTGKTEAEYLHELAEFVDAKVDNEKILEGLGSLVSASQRQWIVKNLKKNVVRSLAIRAEALV